MGDDGGARADQSQELAAAIHETTNALTVILGWIERARDACDGQPEASTALGRAARYTRQLITDSDAGCPVGALGDLMKEKTQGQKSHCDDRVRVVCASNEQY